MIRSVLPFAAIALTPLVLLAAGMSAGDWGIWAALVYMTALTWVADRLTGRIFRPAGSDTADWPANALSVALAAGHVVLLVLAIKGLTGGYGHDWPARLALFFATGLFIGQVSNANAHELIHRADPALRWLGIWVYISHLFGHHASAHPRVHHVHVATESDPNSARPGESFYRFWPRAWWGSFRAGWTAENDLRRRGRRGIHPYAIYVGGAVAMQAGAWLLAGWSGLLAHLALAAYATMQLLLSDYVQHYGLRRAILPDGRPEPVAGRHSWNAPHWFTAFLMLNAPRHSDHHAHPQRPYPALDLTDDMPMLPRSLPVMGAIALIPPLWRRMMDHRVSAWTQAR